METGTGAREEKERVLTSTCKHTPPLLLCAVDSFYLLRW